MPELIRDDNEALNSVVSKGPPFPGSPEEKEIFRHLQENFMPQFENAFPDPLAHKTVVIVPSLTLDQLILAKIEGIVHYEERLLCLLMLLRMPRTHVIFVTSVPIDPVIVDYYLHLLPGITGYHARNRLTLLSCFDASPRSLTEKILERPRMIQRIKESIPAGHLSHLACFNVTPFERQLAVALHMPLYGCDPDLYHYGDKSNGRKLFKACGLTVPEGVEDVRDILEIAEALHKLKHENPELRKAVIKMNEGFSGEGNAIFAYDEFNNTVGGILEQLPVKLRIVANDLSFSTYMSKFEKGGGIVEAFIDGNQKRSPSVQCRITPLGVCNVVSTHDQELGGESGQVFLGAHFPANTEYAKELGEMGKKVGEALQELGALGRFGIDFISVKNGNEWKHYAIEINLRKGGTTHPYLMLDYLTQGHYNPQTGVYRMANGQPRYYFSSDNLHNPCYRGITPHDLIDIAMVHELRYDGSTQEGVTFHLIGALSQFGKLGVVCIGETPEKAQIYFRRTVEVLEKECRK
ncbi:MAG: peptide ligase PGM1-related protein [Chitinophagaceae bacterium]|nr:peptide ligase PGM1-related protein [Chitinophagaceae bacterium]